MKPISVRFQCFGPYIHEQYIDFTQLEKNGLFLICGETGSGKTTILDAMCYALYGRSSGGLRGDISVMRCKQADPSMETFVEYIFSSGEHTYRFYRSLKPRKKRKGTEGPAEMNETCECQILEDGVFVPLADSKDKKTFLNEKAKELIGLSYEQFRQVIILPQGQFEKLLVSTSDEKEKILVTLFHAERWQRMAEEIFRIAYDRSKELEKDKLRMTERLGAYQCATLEELAEKAQALRTEGSAMAQQLQQAEALLNRRQQEQNQIALDSRSFAELDACKSRLEQLASQKKAFEQEGHRLLLSDKAESLTPIYQTYQSGISEQTQKRRDRDAAEKALADAQAKDTRAQQMKKEHEDGRAAYEKDKARIILLENSAALYASLSEKEAAKNQAEQEEQNAARKAKSSAIVLANITEAYEHAALAQRAAMEAQQEGQRLYLLSIGSVLAEKLVEGEKCPVCGSLHHPEPARPTQHAVSDARLEQLSRALKKATQAEEDTRAQRKSAEADNTRFQEVLQLCAMKTAQAKSDWESSLAQRIEGIDTEDQRKAQLEKRMLAAERYEQADRSMQQLLTEAASSLQAARSVLETARAAYQAAEEACAGRRQLWTEALSSAGFADEEEYRSSCLEPEQKRALQHKLVQYQTDCKNVKADLDAKSAALEGRERPDAAAADRQLREARSQRDRLRDQSVLQEKLLQDMDRDGAALQKQERAYDEAKRKNEELLVFAKRLRGDTGLSLQRYVLGVMLTSITHAANRLLKTVYGGRYQLYRTNEATGKTHKRGLELEVEDRDGRRSVTTLSGGEKFLLALSLAIGLSTVVQAQGGGVRLEAMFIDEGFGSLDRKSIDDALEVLQTVQRSSGIVGIISHVDRLAETIPTKIEITKTKEGSEARVCF